jgi:uncharacterized protein YbjT (DUF2867 family)
VRQLSNRSENLVIAVVRNPTKAHQPEILGRPNVAVVRADLSNLDAFEVSQDISKATSVDADWSKS